MASVTVKHHPSGGPVDHNALVDGPTYDNDPHIVTGLENVDNTADASKPVSTAQAAAIALKVTKQTLTDNAIVRADGTSGEVQNSLVTIDDLGNIAIPAPADTTNHLGIVVLGTGGTNSSLRSAYQIRRTLSDTDGSFHGFADNTLFNGVTASGYGSFDSRVTYSGTLANDHFNSYQSVWVYNNTNTMQTHQAFLWGTTVSNGHINSIYGIHLQCPIINAPGTVPDNLAGILIDDFTAASGGAGIYRAILTNGDTPSQFGGSVISLGTTFAYIARSATPTILLQSASAVSWASFSHNGTATTVSNALSGPIYESVNGTNVVETNVAVHRPVADGTTASGDASHRWGNVTSVLFTATGSILANGVASGVGYTTGAGFAASQATSRTTGITFNRPTGAITMFSAAGSATPASFTVTNSTVAATDTVILNIKSGATNTYVLSVTTVAAGSFAITFYTTGGTATDAPVINFNLIKGAAS
jgi:hypothetical protein